MIFVCPCLFICLFRVFIYVVKVLRRLIGLLIFSCEKPKLVARS